MKIHWKKWSSLLIHFFKTSLMVYKSQLRLISTTKTLILRRQTMIVIYLIFKKKKLNQTMKQFCYIKDLMKNTRKQIIIAHIFIVSNAIMILRRARWSQDQNSLFRQQISNTASMNRMMVKHFIIHKWALWKV